jgi:hydroxymethylpyrimidine/phosphomethylpyrimidine kinase
MKDILTSTPVVLSINSLDPTGGSGISADIETLASIGCHCTPVVTQLLTGNTGALNNAQITDSSLLIEQIRSVLEDISVNLISIGDVGSISNVEAIHTILNDYPDIPVLFHSEFDQDNTLGSAMLTLLFPQADLSILSKQDILMYTTGADTLAASAQELMEYGCSNVLITDDNTNSTQITNHWFSKHSSKQIYHRERLPYHFNGANSTLAAAISAYLAHGLSMAESIQQAHQFTWQALQKARRLGMTHHFPDRMHWCKK